MSDVTDPNSNEFTERFWRLIDKHLGCRVPLYIKNLLKLRGFDNATSIRTLTNEDYEAFEKFARTKMEKYIPATSNRADYYHMYTRDPHAFEILPGHIRLLNEIVTYITDMTSTHDPTFFDPYLQFGNGDNSIGQSQELFKSNDKLDHELTNSANHSLGRSQQLVKSNGIDNNEFKSIEGVERQFGVLKPLGVSQDFFRSNRKVHEPVGHTLLRRSKSNDVDFGRKKYINPEQLQPHPGLGEIIQTLLQNSTNLDSYRSGENCRVIHVNSISDFYIQMESDANALDKLADYLQDESKFNVLTDIKDGIVCAAKFMEDGLWYRAIVKSHTADNTEVLFIDYGNSSLTNELRIIPPEIANAPSLAKHCSMVKPNDILFWSANAEKRFLELTDNETYFMVEVISPGVKSIINLFDNQKSFLEEISCLSVKHSLSSSNTTLQSKADAVVGTERVKALILGGSPDYFYIHLESDFTELDKLWELLKPASAWPLLGATSIGQMCAALFEGSYYRATISSASPVEEGVIVHYVDYGNKSISTDLRQLPDNLQSIRPMAISCSLETENGIYSPGLVERFEKLSREDLLEIRFLSENSTPAIVQLFEYGVQSMDEPTRIPEPNESTLNSMREGHISEKVSSSHCQMQLDTDMDETNKTVIKTMVYRNTVTVDELQEPKNVIDDIKTLDEQNQHEKLSTSTSDGGTTSVSLQAVGEALAQCNKPTINGEGILNRLKDIPYKLPKFIEPVHLIDDDFVRIRYIESPIEFYVQKTTNIAYYNDMMDKLMQHCLTAPSLKTFETGMACAVRCQSDSEWYRAQIENVNGTDASVRFVDFGIVLTTETNNLKEIGKGFMIYPRQAVRCCLYGFDAPPEGACNLSIERMELLADNSLGERRNFRVKIHGHINDSVLVNLIDESDTPTLNLSYRMMQLSLSLEAYRSWKIANRTVDPPVPSDSEFQDAVNSQNNHQKYTDNGDIHSLSRIDSSAIKDRDSKFIKNQDYVKKSYESWRETLSPEGIVDPDTQIPFEEISINASEEVKLSWCFSPLEFYVSTTKHEADLTIQKKNINIFYKKKTPATTKFAIGSFVIAKYSKDNQLYRAEIIDYNEKLNKYKARLIDVGALTILDIWDIYEMDKRFAKCERRAILCSLRGVALRASRFDMESALEKYLYKKLVCKCIKRKGDKFYVDIEADGIDVKEALIRDKYLSVLSEDIEIERLVGQTVMAKVLSMKDWSSLQLVIFGCETIFEASCKDFKLYSESTEHKELPMQVTIPVRIDSLLVGQTFSVTPLIDTFGEAPSSPIGKLPFFCNNFKVLVTYWETHNVAYVQSVNADSFEQSVLTKLFEYYKSNGEGLQEFIPETLCAVQSADENWYRAEIISVAETYVKVRYIDYGNFEIIPKDLVKRLEPQFFETPVLAIKVHLPLKESQTDEEISVDVIDTCTSHITLDLTVLEYYAENWIVDMFKDGESITSFIKTTTRCETLTVDEFKKQLDEKKISVNVTPQLETTGNNHQVETKSKVTLADAEMPTLSQNMQLDCNITSKTKAYLSHVDRPDRFYLQVLSESDELDLELLQENIQIVAPSLPPLQDFSTGNHCIVRYFFDGQWYRGVIIDSDTRITTILFIDYGNTDIITDNSLIKSVNEALDELPAYAIPCALPLEAKDRDEWSEESCQLLKDLVNAEVEFEYVSKGKTNNFVKLYHGERDIIQELVQDGYAIKLNPIGSGENCYVSHVNSISDFYIQMGSDTDALEKLADYLLDVSKCNVLTDVTDGIVCAAKFMDDGLWYRGKIKSHTAENTEVFFIDYGNSSLTKELRIIPPEIANAPSLAKHCSMVKPKDIQYWSESAEQRFMELNDIGTIFKVDVLSPGKISSVDLFVNEKSVLEEISDLCDLIHISHESIVVPSETLQALIVDGSPGLFYIQLERTLNELYQLWELLVPAGTWPILDEAVVGEMCAALFEGVYYRAKILSLDEEGATVQYVDYGNKSISTDLRELPENLHITEPIAVKCALESSNGIYSPELVERFQKLSRDDLLEIKYISKDSSPVIIQLFENGVLFADMPAEITDQTQKTLDMPAEITEPTVKTLTKAYITEIISPSHFYIQLDNDIEKEMTSASEFPLLEDSDIRAGKLCAAFWEEAFYRAEILAIDEEGIKVQFIDYGNESYATDLRQLPEHIEKIERALMLCRLESSELGFSDSFSNKFSTLNLDSQYEFEIVDQSIPCMIRLYVNGELFSDMHELHNIDERESVHVKVETNNSIVKEIINEAIEIAENRHFAD